MQYKYQLNEIYSECLEFLQNIKSHFSKSSQSIHKARNELKILSCNDKSVVVKSFKVPHLLNRVIYSFFRTSKAHKSYEYALKINQFTPEPIGYIEFYESFLLTKSYFISETFEYDFTIREPLLDANFTNRENVFRAFSRFALELHNEGIFHKDFSPGNILIKEEDGNYIFKIVDINRMQFFPLSEDDRAKNFSKLWASDAILTIMADEYKKNYKCSEAFTNKVLYYSNKNKKIKNFKKRLKGEVVND